MGERENFTRTIKIAVFGWGPGEAHTMPNFDFGKERKGELSIPGGGQSLSSSLGLWFINHLVNHRPGLRGVCQLVASLGSASSGQRKERREELRVETPQFWSILCTDKLRRPRTSVSSSVR